MSNVRQCDLREVTENPERKLMTTWLDADRNVQVGMRLTLKGIPDIVWHVMRVGVAHNRLDIKRGWGHTDYFVKEGDRK